MRHSDHAQALKETGPQVSGEETSPDGAGREPGRALDRDADYRHRARPYQESTRRGPRHTRREEGRPRAQGCLDARAAQRDRIEGRSYSLEDWSNYAGSLGLSSSAALGKSFRSRSSAGFLLSPGRLRYHSAKPQSPSTFTISPTVFQ